MIGKAFVRSSATLFSTHAKNVSRYRSSYDEPADECSMAVRGVIVYFTLGVSLLIYRTIANTVSAVVDVDSELTSVEKIAYIRKASKKGAQDGAQMFYPLMHLAEFINNCYKKPACFLEVPHSEETSANQASTKGPN